MKAHDKKRDAAAARKERERLKSIQFPRSDVVRGEAIYDLSTIRHAHRRASSGKARR